MIIYLQGKVFLQKAYGVLTERLSQNKQNILISAMSLLCVLTEQILVHVDTYYVDWLALPFLLRILFADRQDNGDIPVLGVMAGICVCIKPSNLIFVLLLFLLYVLRFYRDIRSHAWISGIICSFLVCFPYLYMSHKMTNNPVFPYLNKIFRSEWFLYKGVEEYSGIRELFGPGSLKEYLWWPYYMVFRFDSIHFADYRVYHGRLLAALIVGIFCVVGGIRRNRSYFLLKVNGILICLYIYKVITYCQSLLIFIKYV